MDLHDLALQFEALLGEELEVADVVSWMLICIIVPELSWNKVHTPFRLTTVPFQFSLKCMYKVNTSCLFDVLSVLWIINTNARI